MIKIFKEKKIPTIPSKAKVLMEKYHVPEGRELGKKLRAIEETWINNNFQISEKEIEKIVKN